MKTFSPSTSLRLMAASVLALLCLAVVAGCAHIDDAGVGIPLATLTAAPQPTTASLRFQVVVPGGAPIGRGSALRAEVGSGPREAAFHLHLLQPGTASEPVLTLSRTVPIAADGTASATFNDVPTVSVVAVIRLTNARVASATELHGAKDLLAGTNVVTVTPVGSGLIDDVIAATLRRAASQTTVLNRIGTGFVAQTRQIAQQLDLASSTVVDETWRRLSEVGMLPRAALVYNGIYADPASALAMASMAASRGLSVTYFSSPAELPTRLSTVRLVAIGGTKDDIDGFAAQFTTEIRAAIHQFVRGGGVYLGICGGGYIGSTGWTGVAGPVPGLALASYSSDPFLAATAAQVITVAWKGQNRPVYYQYGPKFLAQDQQAVNVTCRYSDNTIAGLWLKLGRGTVYLLGPHPEADSTWIDANTLNGAAWQDTADLASDTLTDALRED